MAHVNQADIAAKMGVHPSAIHRILTGEQRMTIYHAKCFMDMLNVSLEEIFINMGVQIKTGVAAAPLTKEDSTRRGSVDCQ